jgi:serine protein kinase
VRAGNNGTLARFSVMSRPRKHETPCLRSCGFMTVKPQESDPKARSVQEYKDAAGRRGMDGVSTRFAFKVLAATFDHDT